MRIYAGMADEANVAKPSPLGKDMSRRAFLAGLGALGIGAVGGLGFRQDVARARANLPPGVTDAITHRAYDAVKGWMDWLKANGVKGYFGETGWPNDRDGARPDIAQWNALGEKVYSWLDSRDIWVTYWSASVTRGPDGVPGSIWLAYGADDYSLDYSNRDIGEAYSQAAVIERHAGYSAGGWAVRRGVNAGGGELCLGMTDFSNKNPGVYGRNYLYPSRESLAFLRSRGHDLVRLPFRWERVQPVPGGSLNLTEIGRIQRVVSDAEDLGMVVILDVHNFAQYRSPEGGLSLGDSLKVSDFADLWRRLSLVFGEADSVRGYDIMNEPRSVVGGAAGWERASQAAVDAVRSTGDKTRIMVPGFHPAPDGGSGGVFAFRANHPRAWIKDPLKRFFYTTHGYWGHYQYEWTYDQSNAYWAQKGY